MASILDAINAAAAELQGGKKEEQPKSEPKTGAKAAGKSANKAAPNGKATAKTGCAYKIPASFKTAIEGYLNKREDMKEKMKNPEKNISGCCDYIYRVMQKRAEKERGSSRVVGMYVEPDEVFGLAVHYYDEKNEDLEKELKN